MYKMSLFERVRALALNRSIAIYDIVDNFIC